MMNKEKLEQMKKEKLEQMRELGRGGISRGLSLLQKANTALNTTTMAGASATGEDGDDGGSAADMNGTALTEGGGGMGGAAAASGGGGRPSYDDLVSLSMKLTRQNKLMKAQFQKMQARMAEFQARDADCHVLASFASDVVGVDLVACQLQAASQAGRPDDDETTAATIDAKQLKERYEIINALKFKALTQQIAQLQAATPVATGDGANNDSVSLWPLSPVGGDSRTSIIAPPPTAPSHGHVHVPQYDEIDLISDPLPAAPPASASYQQQQQPPNSQAIVGDLLSLPVAPASGPSPSAAAVELLEKQLAETTSQLRQLEAQMARCVGEKEALQREQAVEKEQLTVEKTQLERLVETATVGREAAEKRIVELEAAATNESDVDELHVKLKEAMAKQDALKEQVHSLELAVEDAAAVSTRAVAALTLEKEQLLVQLQERPPVAASAPAPAPSNGNSNSSDVNALMDELERVKMARAEADHSVKTLQDRLSLTDKKLLKSQTEVEQNVAVIGALRGEMARLVDAIKQLEEDRSAAEETISTLREQQKLSHDTTEELEEQVQMLRVNNSSNLESVVGELASAKQQAAEQREYMDGKIEMLIKELDASRKQSEQLECHVAEKETQNQKMASSQAALTSELVTLQRQVATMEEDLQMAALGLEAQATKCEANELKQREMDQKLANAKLSLETLKDQHLQDLELLRSGKENELERMKNERATLLKRLQDAQISFDDVSLKCSALQDDVESERKKATSLELRMSQFTSEIGNMSIDLAETKKALSDRMALATRLQTENMKFAETQAEQAARVESALREASASKQLVLEMETKVEAAHQQVVLFQRERDRAVDQMATLVEEMEKEKNKLNEQFQANELKYQTQVEAEKETFRKQLERVESDSKHKSKLALHAVLAKEAEIEKLSKRLAELEEDVRSGDADNRKIFEVAQMQANREMEARANGAKIHELTKALEVANSKIQELLQDQSRHAHEVTAMMQTQRREGVNMEYLKNVIVQFMSFKPGSSQQQRLVPVITTLLQFSAADMKEIKQAGRRSSWTTWGADASDTGGGAVKTIPPTPHSSGGGGGLPLATRRRTSPPTSSEFHRTASAHVLEQGSQSLPSAAGSVSRASSFTLPPHDEDALTPTVEEGNPSAALASTAHANTESAHF